MTIYTWILIAIVGLSAATNLFAPLTKENKPETMATRGTRLILLSALLVYLIMQL
jgi:hypothetical protein